MSTTRTEIFDNTQKTTTLKKDMYAGTAIGILTSGGDAQGMNAALRAAVRMGIFLGCEVYCIHEGYEGLVEGGDLIKKAEWASVSSIIHRGGTVIGSARCPKFTEWEYAVKAAKNLVERGITYLVTIGGDGTLTGANRFKQDWTKMLDELLQKGEITSDQKSKYHSLNIVGIVGTIDNDFVGTDVTIGSNTALHRILEAVDIIVATAHSHKRTFILEVMGRHCGYLGLVSAITTEADYVFIPEVPEELDWADKLCTKLTREIKSGKRANIIIVAEGAIDINGEPIKAKNIKKVVVDRTQQDTRITVLGHVQRGGHASAADRILGTRLGAEAVVALFDSEKTGKSWVIGYSGHKVTRLPLMLCVEASKAVAEAMANKNYKRAIELRGLSFKRNVLMLELLAHQVPPDDNSDLKSSGLNLAVMHIGATSCGMNAAVRAFVVNCIAQGHKVFGIQNGVEGFILDKVRQFQWGDVDMWSMAGGAYLGTKRILPEKHFEKVSETLQKYNIHGLLLIGGFESFHGGLQMYHARHKYPAFRIPIIVLPCSISNNIPGTEMSVGADSALNEIVACCDRIRQSAQGIKKRVFIVEVMGRYCGYLATLGGLAAGADHVYTNEVPYSLANISNDIESVKMKMTLGGIERGLVIRTEQSSPNYNTQFLQAAYSEEGKSIFSVRSNILGHIQNGGNPSPFDRNLGFKFAARAAGWLACQAKTGLDENGKPNSTGPNSCVLLGFKNRHYAVTPLEELISKSDFQKRTRIKEYCWWLVLLPLWRIAATHHKSYLESEKTVEWPDAEIVTEEEFKEKYKF